MMFLALKHLLSRKRQTFFIFAGIVLGTMIYIFISGMQLGFREFIIEQLVENDAHLKISGHEEVISPETMAPAFYPDEGPARLWIVPPFGKRGEAHILYPQGWFDRLSRDENVLAYSQQLSVQILANRSGVKVAGQLIGVLPERQLAVTIIKNYMTEGSFLSIGNSGQRVIMGEDMMKNLGGRVGESVWLASGSQNPKPFKIAGTFKLGVKQIDESWIFGALRDVQQLNGTAGRISQIAVRLADVTEARSIAENWALTSRDKVQSWDQANVQFLQVFKIQDIFRIFITWGILIVASFGIYNVLSIIVNQKKREIAILRSLGFPPRDILELFLSQGLILGFTGAMVGLGLGYLLCVYMANLDLNLMGKKGLSISFAPSIYLNGFLMALISTTVASLVPARAASRMTPIDIIRSEG